MDDIFSKIASQFGAEVAHATLDATRYQSEGILIQAALTIILSFCWFMFLLQIAIPWIGDELDDSDTSRQTAGFICLAVTFFCLIMTLISVYTLANPTNWLGLFNPRAAIAMQLLYSK